MLNELQVLRQGLAGSAIAVTVRHGDLKTPAKTETIRVRLDTTGKVQRIDSVPGDQMARSWTLRDGQQNSFPYIKFQTAAEDRPLISGLSRTDARLRIAQDEARPEGERIQELLAAVKDLPVDESAGGRWPKYLGRLRERLDQLRPLESTPAAAVPAVFARFIAAAENPGTLLGEIVAAFLVELRQRPSGRMLQLALGLLVDGTAEFYFDVDSSDDFEFDAGDSQNIGPISELLIALEAGEPDGQCALSGNLALLVAEKFPQPNLPLLGQTYLFARNSDTPCSFRYSRSGPASMPVGVATIGQLQGALDAITSSDRKDKTWASVPSEVPKKSDLLLAFVTGAPGMEPEKTAGALVSEEIFEEFSRRAVEAFRGRDLDRKEARLRIVVLRQVDPANRKAIHSEETDVRRLLSAANQWSRACEAVPPVRLPVPQGRGNKAVVQSPPRLAPASLVGLSRQQFIRRGTQRQELVGGPFADALAVFWGGEDRAREAARRWLRLLVRRRRALIEGIGQAQLGGIDELKGFDTRAALETVTALHLMVTTLGRPKEVYMNEAGYELGQLLAAADVLHRGYCLDVRSGSVPTQLIGNAAIALATASPQRALSVLSRRWPVYHAWAKKKGYYHQIPKEYDKEWKELKGASDRAEKARHEGIRAGAAVARRVESLAQSLHSRLGEQTDDRDRFCAELLLGYISGPPRAARAPGEPPENPPEEGE